MGVQLNIKNPDTVRLARELANANGTTMTQAIHAALDQATVDREAAIQAKVRRVNEIVEEFQRSMPEDWKNRTSKEIMDAIYDDEQEDGFTR